MYPSRPAAALVALLGACAGHPAPRGEAVAITLQPRLGSAPLLCATPSTLDGKAVELIDLRFYVHDLELADASGAVAPLILDEGGADEPFQTRRLALIDLEDAAAGCRNGSTATHATLRGHAPHGAWTRLRGRIGVPFDMNHGDPVQDPAPLAPTAMQWSWLSGHTFLRFDVRVDGRPLRTHLGSFGCSGEVGHVQACSWPNRPRFDLPMDAQRAAVIDFAPLLRAALAAGPESHGCMGDPQAPGCIPVFHALGLSTADGTATSKAAL